MKKMVVFVTTDDLDICPVVNSASRAILHKWMAKLVFKKVYTVLDIANESLYTTIEKYRDAKLVAVGNRAAKELKSISLEYFKLPDPSPRNTFLKNKVQMDAVLEECVIWLQK